jgi:hypothetical protein
MLRRTFASIASLASLALTACPGDDGSPVDTDPTGSSTSGPNDTLPITDPMMTLSDSSGESTSPGTGTDGSSTAVLDDTSSGTTGTTGEPGGVWMADFASEVVMDPEDDDQGPGTYSYPLGVDDGSSDLRSFQLSYTAADAMLHFTIELTSISDNTRISMLLLDDPAWANAGVDVVYTVGGTEVRAPNWNDSGVQLVLMDPDSPLFDFGAINDIDPFSDNPRPDNAIYLREASGAPFLGADGMPSYSADDVQRLDVTVDTTASPNTMTFDVDANWLVPYLDTEGANLYVAIWTYTLIDLPMDQWFQIEFGALEITEALGGLPGSAMDDWRDCDAYDVMFFDGAYTQEEFLTVPEMFAGDPSNTVVTFENVGEGVLQVPTGA